MKQSPFKTMLLLAFTFTMSNAFGDKDGSSGGAGGRNGGIVTSDTISVACSTTTPIRLTDNSGTQSKFVHLAVLLRWAQEGRFASFDLHSIETDSNGTKKNPYITRQTMPNTYSFAGTDSEQPLQGIVSLSRCSQNCATYARLRQDGKDGKNVVLDIQSSLALPYSSSGSSSAPILLPPGTFSFICK